MTPKYYFRFSQDEICYPIEYFSEVAKADGLSQITLYEAVPETVPGFFWCKAYELPCKEGEGTCGRTCQDYAPKNKKWGICSHKCPTFYYNSGEQVVYDVQSGQIRLPLS